MDAVEDPKVKQLRIVAMYVTCLYSVMIYDWLLQLPQEWKYIWRSKPTFVSGLYVLLRYWCIIKFAISLYLVNTDFTYEACKPWAAFQLYANLPITIAVSALLSLRLYALYERSKPLLAALSAMILAFSGVIAHAMREFEPPRFLAGHGACNAQPKADASNLNIALWLAPFMFDIIVTALLVIRVFVLKARSGNSSSNLLQILVRDGLIFFGVISTANLLNVAFYLAVPPRFKSVNSSMSFIVACAASCRMILSLRQHADGNHSDRGFGAEMDISKKATVWKRGSDHMSTRVALPPHPEIYNMGGSSSNDEEEKAVLPGVFVVTEKHTQIDRD